MATAAQMLADALEDMLAPLSVGVIPDTQTLGEIDGELQGMLQLVVDAIEPTGQIGQWLTRWEGWLVVPSKDPTAAAEELEQLLPVVVGVLESIAWLVWDRAERTTHPEQFAAWRLTFTTLT